MNLPFQIIMLFFIRDKFVFDVFIKVLANLVNILENVLVK